MSDKRRQQFLIDNEVQVDLVWQALRFWGLSIITTGLFICIGIALFGEQRSSLAVINELFFHYGPAAVASIIVMPLVLTDIFRHSNRFAGPIYRLRTVLKKLANGERVGPIKFRDDDYWQDLADDFNRALERLQGPEPEGLTGENVAQPGEAETRESPCDELPTFPVIRPADTKADSTESSPTIVG